MTQTHQVTIEGSVVTKTYVSCPRDEHLREWSALQTISTSAPDLAPTPLSLTPGPTLSMSLLPGVPLRGALTRAELTALETALRRLWSLPTEGLLPLPLAPLVARVRSGIASHNTTGVIAEAHEAAASWLATSEVDALLLPAIPVLGHGDPNLSNYLWDGVTVRIIDFEDSGVSDLALELANLVEHLAGRETDWSGLLSHFPVEPQRLLTARRLWAAFWLTLLRPGGPAYHRNPPSTAVDQAERVLRLSAGSSG
ncbi:phosphotransferase [Kribbella sancticallisti]